MRIEIDSKKINYSSNIIGEENKIDEENKEILNQLSQQIIYGNNSSFLISGYRGTGKTTMVHILERAAQKSDVIFVHLNLSKYENYSLVLRKLIREIYLSLSSSKIFAKLKGENKSLVDKIGVLYDHTFFELFSSSSVKSLKELSIKIEGNYDIKSIVKHLMPIITVVLSSLNISFNIVPLFLENLNIFIQFVSIIWLIYDSIKIKGEVQGKKTSMEELNRKSLYDDEIAEYHLKNILIGLNEAGIKTVFVFDELDKIEDESEMERLISDIKPLLLSNLASFIVISGQKLYYKFVRANLLDDSIMTSIFSKNIHIPLATNISLEKLFDYYIMDKNYLENEAVKNYRDSLILNSHKTLRRFINLILQDVVWENNKSYLCIEQENVASYNTDSIILNILTQIIETNIDDLEYEDGVKDFLTYQLFIWIKKMKLKGKVFFASDEIFNFEKDYSDVYPVWCKLQLSELCNKLINSLLEVQLLEKKEEEGYEEVFYKWTSNANIKNDNINNDLNQIKSQFLEDMIQLEKYCRDICLDLSKETALAAKSLKQLIIELTRIGVVGSIMSEENMKELYIINNKVRHGVRLKEQENEAMLHNVNHIKMLISYLLEGYCYYVIERYLRAFNYNVSKGIKPKINLGIRLEFDIVAEKDNSGDIIFEIKYRNNFRHSDINIIYKLIKQLKEYNNITKKQNHLVVFWFSKESRKSFEKFKIMMEDLIGKDYYELKGFVHIFYASEYRSNFNSKRMETYLDKVMKSMTNVYPNIEVAATTDN